MRTKVVNVPGGPSRHKDEVENYVTICAAPWENESEMPQRVGYRTSSRESSPDEPLRNFWWAILERAIMDLVIGEKTSENRAAMRSAKSWFDRGGSDFKMACTNAGFDPDFVRDSYLSGKLDPYQIAMHKAAVVKRDIALLEAEMDERRAG